MFIERIKHERKIVMVFQEQLARFKKMENFSGVKRHALTHRAVFFTDNM